MLSRTDYADPPNVSSTTMSKAAKDRWHPTRISLLASPLFSGGLLPSHAAPETGRPARSSFLQLYPELTESLTLTRRITHHAKLGQLAGEKDQLSEKRRNVYRATPPGKRTSQLRLQIKRPQRYCTGHAHLMRISGRNPNCAERRHDPNPLVCRIHPQNPRYMRDPGADGRPRHWILEIHFVDRARKIGGFYEQLLIVD